MPVSKDLVVKHVEEIKELLAGPLKGKERAEQVRFLVDTGEFNRPAICKVFRLNSRSLKKLLGREDSGAADRGKAGGGKPGKGKSKKRGSKGGGKGGGAGDSTTGELPPGLTQEDLEYQRKIRDQRMDARIPIVEKEIMDSAWFHNLCQDFGKYGVLKLWGDSNLDQAKAENWIAASAVLKTNFDTLLKLRKDVALVQVLRANLMSYMAAYDLLKEDHQKLKTMYALACRAMPPETKQRILTALAMRQVAAM